MKKTLSFFFAAAMLMGITLSGCSTSGGKMPKLDPDNPITLEIWHYYNGPQKTAFDSMVSEFNETVGLKDGIIVEAFSQGDVNALSGKVIAAAGGEAGSEPLPAIFATYADTAYEVDQLKKLADLDNYFTPEELSGYRTEFIAEGRFSVDGSLKIFPIAKSVELLMVNLTDWEKFASDTGRTLAELTTIEGIVSTAQAYYDWTDRLTDAPDDGKALFGRDAMANYMIIGCQQLGVGLFLREGGNVSVNADAAVVRKLWDNYYVPYISGWFSANGRFRSDEATLGDIIALVGSSSAASYFPNEITVSDYEHYPIECAILPAPHFSGSDTYAIQQGAGMAVTTGDQRQEYASAVFLKWFTQPKQNIRFAAASGGYLPVTNEALDLALIDQILAASPPEGQTLDRMRQTFAAALEALSENTMYTPPPFHGNIAARAVLEQSMNDQAKQDREAVLALVANGAALDEAVSCYDTDAQFEAWYDRFLADLESALG